MVATATSSAVGRLLNFKALPEPVAVSAGEHIYVIKRLDSDGAFVCVYDVLTGPPGINMAQALRSYIQAYDIPRPVLMQGFVNWLKVRYHLVGVRDYSLVDVATDDANSCLWAE